jgi:hypothetical protein
LVGAAEAVAPFSFAALNKFDIVCVVLNYVVKITINC